MLKHKTLEHKFVRHVPDVLEPGVLYVSVEFGTIVHSCCCGCGTEVVTPLTPTDWQLTYDGETVSLWPSVGSWQIKCRSHYIIDRGRVMGAGKWTPAQIAAERHRDQAAKAKFYGSLATEPDLDLQVPVTPISVVQPDKPCGRWARFKRWWMS